ncbi:NACHT domain-containing protein [Nostoc sp. ChiVER01]|uniref:NACHT domain-containing protein n=1 Tax=Nostoc sp. ChiVER01 TaxID=3075382 RepID=UPI002AD3F965|nr:NACHT domain-containing protein [Nostoc sp. ChiVER01]MDZ8226514.1 NACHT domain-containing protein [Nostoc sp. ChiVER01]
MPTTNKEREIRIAQRRVEGFAQQFGEAHRNLARHAAFPLVLTPDLLYQIWANFVPEASWTAVAHVLLSRLCRQVGYEMYEMDIPDRNLLLRELKEQFGQERFDDLGEFLLDYVAQRLTDDDADTRDLREVQEWTALAYTKPDEAARELAEIISLRVKLEDVTEVFRLTPLIETFAEPLTEAGYEPLLVYTRGIGNFFHGNLKTAQTQLSKLNISDGQVKFAGVNLEIPTQILDLSRYPALPKNEIAQNVLGNDNTIVQGNNNLMVTIQELILGQQTTKPIGNPARPKNERILLASVKEEVTARLKQSLHNAVLINLGKQSQPQQVKRPWDAEIKIGLKPAEPLPNTTTILKVFDSEEIAGKLLILGAPGSGKTTTQLELAQELIKRAEEQPDYPVPVLFNLSSWKDDRQSITNWLLAELKSKYGVSTKLGKEWVENKQLLPLLDGLDELEPQRQEICVYAINQFLASENRAFYLVVCSRSEEYSNCITQLQLNGAIYLQPLSNSQIRDYLASVNYIEFWSTISNDLDLLDLVKTPLILSISVLAFGELSAQEWQHLNSTSDRLQYLLDAYITRVFTRNIQSRVYTRDNIPSLKQTRIWLICLARTLQEQSQTIFSSEEIQALSRLQKYWRGEMPWNYRRFLDYATERLILQRIGRQYMFIHKLLQDHFAQMSLPQD